MDHYIRDQHYLTHVVELDGKIQDDKCIEAKSSTKDTEGWVRRKWVKGWGTSAFVVDKKFYGKVFIIRITE